MEKKYLQKGVVFLTILFIIQFSMCFVNAEEIDLGGYEVEKVDKPVITTPKEIEKPVEEEITPRSFSASITSLDNMPNNYLISKFGEDYFYNNFRFIGKDGKKFVDFYNYEFIYGNYTANVFLAVSDDEVIEELSNIPLKPIQILFDDKEGLDKADSLDLPDPKKISLIYPGKYESLAWRVEWDHEPTFEEMENNTISGYLFNVKSGEILEEIMFEIDPKEINEVMNNDNGLKNSSYVKIALIIISILFLLTIIYKQNQK